MPPDTSGLPSDELVDRAAMLDDMVGADAAGLQLAVHAIGDKANATVLDLFTAVVRRNGPRDRRLRIEPAQHLRPADIARFHDPHLTRPAPHPPPLADGPRAQQPNHARRAQ